MEIFKQFTFDAAHFLPHVPEGHKCRNMHGHTYRVIFYFKGDPHHKLGWVTDFTDIKEAISPLISRLDHQVLNDVEGLENPTCELISVWLWNHVKKNLPLLSKIELFETPTSGVVYMGP